MGALAVRHRPACSRLIGDRTHGPLFLADRRPAPARTIAATDLCPHTGRGRLSYERAEYLPFASGILKIESCCGVCDGCCAGRVLPVTGGGGQAGRCACWARSVMAAW